MAPGNDPLAGGGLDLLHTWMGKEDSVSRGGDAGLVRSLPALVLFKTKSVS